MFRHDILSKKIRDNQCFYLLDIGANNGSWASTQKIFNPEIYIHCIEGNEKNKVELEKRFLPHTITLLSDKEKDVKFYFNQKDDVCTGMSYYIEKNKWYKPENYMVVKTKTLKILLDDSDIIYDSMKIDTQGSEIDILQGIGNHIHNFKLICLETSLEEYNIGSPGQDEVIKYMDSIGYKMSGICGESRYPDGKLFQQDLIFIKK